MAAQCPSPVFALLFVRHPLNRLLNSEASSERPSRARILVNVARLMDGLPRRQEPDDEEKEDDTNRNEDDANADDETDEGYSE